MIFLLSDFDERGYKFNDPIRTVFDPQNGVFGSLQLPTSAGNGWDWIFDISYLNSQNNIY